VGGAHGARRQGLSDFTKYCAELSQATIDANLKVDAKVKVFMQASADFRAIGAKVKVDVKKACVNIATDLGAADTWTALGDTDDSIGNAS
jgi:hypothetical protein